MNRSQIQRLNKLELQRARPPAMFFGSREDYSKLKSPVRFAFIMEFDPEVQLETQN